MEIHNLIEHSHKDDIGKYFFSKAVTFAFNNEFGKAYEFFKQGLDILTCDCQRGWLKPNTEINKKVFDDINVKHIPHFEYYFVKAYIMSYEGDKKSQYLALEAIDKYLEVKDDEYGNYVKGKILLALNENQQAFESFEIASSNGTNPRLLYRLGRTKEQLLEQRGLDELYYSFIQNSSSACCARVLKKYMKERGNELVLNENETNPLLIAFNNDEDEWKFQRLYEKLFKSQLENNNPFEAGNTETINSFIQGIKNNSELFVEEIEDDYEGEYYDEPDYDYYEDQTDWTHYDDNLDMDQQSIEFWNQF
ncbi:MAG: hypothetical protein JSR09_05825 [Bacteroidetes bacterium]|nr:hypothetical protein [Bacteroidota bacterium]